MKKNNMLNFMKFISCIMVILIHFRFPGNLGYNVAAVARFSVPLFFMISGYFAYKKENTKSHIKKHILKLIKLCLITTTIYYLYNVGYSILTNNKEFINSLLTFDNLKYFILLNEVPFESWQWFLYALLYIYVIHYFTYKYKIMYYSIPILLFVNIVVGYLISFDVIYFQSFVIRNFIFVGIPFFLLGNLINKYDDKIKVKFNNRQLLTIIIISIVTSVIENTYVGYLDLYISSIILAVSVFLFAIKNPTIIKENNIFSKFGEKYSLGIYVTHTMIIDILREVLKNTNYNGNYIVSMVLPILIILLSILVNYIYYSIKEKIIKKLKKNNI